MSELIKQGNHKGVISDYALKKAKTGVCLAVVAVDVGEHTVYWQGAFTGGASEITIKTLIDIGFNPNRSLLDLARGPESEVLQIGKEVKLAISHEADQEGKMFAKVKWLGSAQGIRDQITYEEAVQTFRGVDGLMAEFKAKNPGVVKRANEAGDIPF